LATFDLSSIMEIYNQFIHKLNQVNSPWVSFSHTRQPEWQY